MKKEIVISGSVALDTLITPKGKMEEILGGSATYAALGARFFVRPAILSCVGEDFPKEYREKMKNLGIALDGVEVRKGKTFRWVAEYGENPQDLKVISTSQNVLEGYSPNVPESLNSKKFLLLANNSPSHQKEILNQMKEKPFVVWDTMKYWIENYYEEVREIMEKIDLALMNDEEARILSGEGNLFKAGEFLIKEGIPRLIVKKGEHGAIYFSSEGSLSLLPAYPVKECFDPTGAGDTFAGVLTGYIGKEGITPSSLKKALLYATIVASFTVEGWGVEKLLSIGEEEIEERVRKFTEWVRV